MTIPTVNIHSPTAQAQALTTLQQGGLVICPTETVYGALVDTTNQAAVDQLLRYKRRPAGKPLSIACANQAMAEHYVDLNDQARQIYNTLLPGPVTVVSTPSHDPHYPLATGLTSEFDTLGIRLPDYPFLLDLIKKFDRPLTATSANRSGKKTPYSINDILTHLSTKQKNLIDLIIDAGTLPKNPPSLVIDTTTSTPIVFRPHPQIALTATQTPATTFHTSSAAATQALAGKILLQHLRQLQSNGLVIALNGSLGAGKTTFTQGLAHFLRIDSRLTSPTYSYLKDYDWQKYDQRGQLHHLDVWTIDQPALLEALQLEQLQQPNHLIVIEWYNNISGFWSPTVPLVQVDIVTDDHDPDKRTIIIS